MQTKANEVSLSEQPKSKDHLRIISQLRLETGEFEVASEAALHRISQSTPAVPAFFSPRQHRNGSSGSSVSGYRPSLSSPYTYPSQNASASSSAGPGGGGGGGSSSVRPFMPTRNRFPESAADDEDEDAVDSSGSEPNYATGAEAASDTGMPDEDDSGYIPTSANQTPVERQMPDPGSNKSGYGAWAMRDSSSSLWIGQTKPLTPGGSTNRLGGDMEVSSRHLSLLAWYVRLNSFLQAGQLSPSSALGWSATTASRPGKRKINDADRFESYSSAFKRRAVSPSTSSVSLSPLLTHTNLANLPLPLPSNLISLGPAANIYTYSSNNSQSMLPPSSVPPSPVIGSGPWLSKSRASSPAPSMSSSAGTSRRWGNLNADDETKYNNKVDLGKMSLG